VVLALSATAQLKKAFDVPALNVGFMADVEL
jgi:hypothetical protein